MEVNSNSKEEVVTGPGSIISKSQLRRMGDCILVCTEEELRVLNGYGIRTAIVISSYDYHFSSNVFEMPVVFTQAVFNKTVDTMANANHQTVKDLYEQLASKERSASFRETAWNDEFDKVHKKYHAANAKANQLERDLDSFKSGGFWKRLAFLFNPKSINTFSSNEGKQ